MNQQQFIHALSTPITNILLNTQLAVDLCQQKNDQSNLTHYLNQSLLAGKYLQSIIKQNKHNKLKKSFSIYTALMTAINLCQFARKKGQIIKYFSFDKKLKLSGSRLNFQEALMCLINNAFEAYQKLNPNKAVILSASQRKTNFHLCITDGGKGMNWLKQKFAPVKGISYKQQHSGLGLAFAKNIFCKQMGGKFKILSKKNRGTTISVSLPLK